MDKNSILAALQDWNFWKKDMSSGIVREQYLSRLKSISETGYIVAITGARRAGKSIIMRQLAKRAINSGLKPESTLFINFEDPRLPELDAKGLQEIYEIYLEFLNPREKPYIFLDEVHEVKGWEKWVRTMHELGKANIIISGSNAHLLSEELATLLTGRHLDIVVFPLSFAEFLNFGNIEVTDNADMIAKRMELKRQLRQYMEFGSFPDVVLRTEKNEILREYFEDVINKDLIRRYRLKKGEKITALAKYYLSNIGCPVSFNSIEKFLGVSSDTINKFSGYLENAYLLAFVKRFSFKVKEQETSQRKVYSIDTGLANALGFRFSENIGKLAENIVFVELNRRISGDSNKSVYYWKDAQQREVDFVIKERLNAAQLVQVCWDISKPETKKREIDALILASDELRCADLLIITEDYGNEEIHGNKKIKFMPLWMWLLK